MNVSPMLSIVPWRAARRLGPLGVWTAVCLVTLLAQGCTKSPEGAGGAAGAGAAAGTGVFGSADEAATALTSALRASDRPRLLAIMGSDAEQILSSGDEVQDRNRREKFLALYDEKHALVNAGENEVTLVVGKADWPFPVPIVRQDGSWRFDTDAGFDEIINRRVGENELSAVQVCRAIADAQREYAWKHPDADGVNQYARQFYSDPGKHNGLYWPSAPGEEPSPLGELAAAAAAEGYTRRTEGPTPYHGYCYRLLEAQGPHAPDGAVSYVVDGKLTLGFAVVAYPAEYGDSGVMTFIMGPEGTVFQKNLGDDTAKLVGEITTFDPGDGWTKVD